MIIRLKSAILAPYYLVMVVEHPDATIIANLVEAFPDRFDWSGLNSVSERKLGLSSAPNSPSICNRHLFLSPEELRNADKFWWETFRQLNDRGFTVDFERTTTNLYHVHEYHISS